MPKLIHVNISSDDGTYYDLEAETLEALANELPESWEGSARARNEQGFAVGFVGRNAEGQATWSAV